jgi:outer membrane protein assembly factor BamB
VSNPSRGLAAAALLALALAIAGCGSGQSTSSAPTGSGRAASSSPTSARTATSTGRSAAHAAQVPNGDWTRFDYDAARSGVGPADTGITAANVKQLSARRIRITGVADSSAVELHAIRVKGRRRDVAILTTTYGRTIALDPGSGRTLWRYVPRDIGTYGNAQVTTASPVLDPNRRDVYAATPDGLIHKLSLATGREVRAKRWPARITFDPRREKIGGALNLNGRYVIAVTGGYYGDAPSYQGHVALIDRSSGRVAHVWNSLCANRHRLIDPPSSCPASDSAIWARAGAVVEPGSGKLLLATGNGPFNGATNWGDSVLELSPDARHVLQNWTPADQAQLNAQDLDLGSTAPALLPSTGGSRLAVQGGKDGHLFLIDLRRLNGTSHASRRLGGELQAIPSPNGGEVLTTPAVWQGGGRTYVFVANEGSTYAYTVSGGSQPRLSEAWHAVAAGTSPLLAGGLLYIYNQFSGELNVRNPATGALLAALPAGRGHWSSPIVVGGRIVLPVGGSISDNASASTVDVFHLPGR